MSYVRPLYNAADASWQGVPAHVRPPYNAADATWQVPTAQVRVTGRRGQVSMQVDAPATAAVTGVLVVQGPRGRVTARADLAVQAVISVVGPRGSIAARGVVVVRGALSIVGPRRHVSVRATVVRYELRGAVRINGVLVDRRVRIHRLADGAVLGEVDTVVGRYRCPAGFAEALCYVIPLDLSAEAVDYAPPCANRVTSVLADDVAEIPV